jgi:segregation and condensation protein A
VSLLIHLERFEGPLALLLHLIRKEEMDIFDINIHQITTQYLEYVKAMKQLDLENAGEFVALASTLIQIKSRLLLPQYNEQGEVIEDADPRQELVLRLMEYQKFQDAAKRLYQRPLVGRDVWLRGEHTEITPPTAETLIVDDNPLFGLISAYRRVLRHMKSTVHRVSLALQSVAERILELREQLQVGMRVGFSELITVPAEGGIERRNNQVLVTFLSLLELAKIGIVTLFQSEGQSEIHIEIKRSVERDVVVRVESYDGGQQPAAESATAVPTHIEIAPPVMVVAPIEPEEEIATDDDILAEEQKIAREAEPTGEPQT